MATLISIPEPHRNYELCDTRILATKQLPFVLVGGIIFQIALSEQNIRVVSEPRVDVGRIA